MSWKGWIFRSWWRWMRRTSNCWRGGEVERQPRALCPGAAQAGAGKGGEKTARAGCAQKEGAGAVTPPRRKRSVQLNFRVFGGRVGGDWIEARWNSLASSTGKPSLRKMALDGYAVRLDLPELKELLSLLRRPQQQPQPAGAPGQHYRAGLRGGPGGYYQETERTLGRALARY